MMDRLSILANYCPKGQSVSDNNLNSRGANIFLPNEPDTKHACLFLVKLLKCIKSWAELYPRDTDTNQASRFFVIYDDLVQKNAKFADGGEEKPGRKTEMR